MGFAMIMGSGGGSNLRFSIKIHEAAPSAGQTGKENEIWVVSETPMTSYAVSANIPSNPTDGMVWIYTSQDADTINLLRKNALEICPNRCSQYINGVWLILDGYYYEGAQWKQFSEKQLVLFRGGVLNPVFGSFGDASITSQYIKVHADGDEASSTQETHSVTSSNAVDLTAYKKLVFTAYASRYPHSSISIVRNGNTVVSKNVNEATATTEEVDISNLSGLYNIRFTAVTWWHGCDLYIYEAYFV